MGKLFKPWSRVGSETPSQPATIAIEREDLFTEKLCDFPGCQELTIFKQNSAFRKHMDKHTRPYKCTENNCKAKNFASAGDLKRHRRSAHGSRAFPCPFPSCKYSKLGFGRKDNQMEHLKRIHKMDQVSSAQGIVAFSSIETKSPERSTEESDEGEEAEELDPSFQKSPGEIGKSTVTDKAGLLAKLRELETKRMEYDEKIAAVKIVLAMI
ncbi:hypothetical protein B0J14DRAFT_7145 [Halenospora varia]|nr:hypothetical protein B0J14DRAFT_7145 [Halenospora varia]